MMDSDIRPHRTGNTLGSSSSSSSELFICFTSRLSSSSMKISSKSILSPGRGRDQQPLSLSNSLSRRLRTNGSMKGGQASPMFPTGGGGKKRGCAFENPEPSSPKVTCIGQVRVKTKKQGKKMRTMSSKRRSSGGDLSFRKVEQSQMSSRDGLYQSNASNNNQEGGGLNQQRNQRWVHLPLTICEALRAFGAEFSCLFPCKSPCFSSSDHQRGEKEDKSASSSAAAGGESSGGQSSCGAVFARWLVAVQDGGGKEREIELVVGGGGEEESAMVRSQRSTFLSRHAEEEEEEDDLQWGEREEEEEAEEEEEEARVSICIPPKNALLLMRCRSDPVQMSALANRLWESPVRNHEEQDEDEDEDEEVDNVNHEDKHNNGDDEEEEQVLMNVIEESEVKEELRSLEEDKGCEELISNEDLDHEQENPETESPETDTNLPLEVQEEAHEEEEEDPEEELEIRKEEELEIEEKQEDEVVVVVVDEEEEVAHHTVDDIDSEAILDDQKKLDNEEDEAELVEEQESSHCSSVVDYSVHPDLDVEEDKALLILEAALEEETEKSTEDHERETPAQEDTLLEDADDDEEKVTVLVERVEQETHEEEEQEEPHSEVIERESHDDEVVVVVKKEEERESSVLPDCLLLMMCEPKLSMEVSKETWVCSTDFIRWLPERHVTTKDGGDHHDHDHDHHHDDEPNKKTVISTDQDYSNPTHHNSHHQQLHLPPRSSCSFPAPAAGVSMAAMIEQKLVNSVAYEPFVLTRCKSEPMRTAAKLAPEACFWKNRKLEPHRNATFGIGAAGVGF